MGFACKSDSDPSHCCCGAYFRNPWDPTTPSRVRRALCLSLLSGLLWVSSDYLVKFIFISLWCRAQCCHLHRYRPCHHYLNWIRRSIAICEGHCRHFIHCRGLIWCALFTVVWTNNRMSLSLVSCIWASFCSFCWIGELLIGVAWIWMVEQLGHHWMKIILSDFSILKLYLYIPQQNSERLASQHGLDLNFYSDASIILYKTFNLSSLSYFL